MQVMQAETRLPMTAAAPGEAARRRVAHPSRSATMRQATAAHHRGPGAVASHYHLPGTALSAMRALTADPPERRGEIPSTPRHSDHTRLQDRSQPDIARAALVLTHFKYGCIN